MMWESVLFHTEYTKYKYKFKMYPLKNWLHLILALFNLDEIKSKKKIKRPSYSFYSGRVFNVYSQYSYNLFYVMLYLLQSYFEFHQD